MISLPTFKTTTINNQPQKLSKKSSSLMLFKCRRLYKVTKLTLRWSKMIMMRKKLRSTGRWPTGPESWEIF